MNNVLGIYYDKKKVFESVVGPNGLPGAYPGRVSAQGVEVVLPGITLEKAIEINKKGGKIDGIEDIKEDGTVVFMDENVAYMREVVGYDCKELKPEDSEGRAKELADRLKIIYNKYNIK